MPPPSLASHSHLLKQASTFSLARLHSVRSIHIYDLGTPTGHRPMSMSVQCKDFQNMQVRGGGVSLFCFLHCENPLTQMVCGMTFEDELTRTITLMVVLHQNKIDFTFYCSPSHMPVHNSYFTPSREYHSIITIYFLFRRPDPFMLIQEKYLSQTKSYVHRIRM